jgi:NADPH2:quinone reductase
MMVLFGQASGPVPPFNPQILNQRGSLYLTRPSLFAYIAQRNELLARMNDLYTWTSNGKLKVAIDRTYALKDVAQAHEYMAGRGTRGKVVLVP